MQQRSLWRWQRTATVTLRNEAGLGALTDAAYAGREFDEFTRLYYNRAREYDPATGRFQSPDPLGFAAGDANLYRYAFNSPTHFTDPSGKIVPLLVIGGLVLANGGYYYAWHESEQASQLAQKGLTAEREAAYQSHVTTSRYAAAVGDIGIAVASSAGVAGVLGTISTFGAVGAYTSFGIGGVLAVYGGLQIPELIRQTPHMDGPDLLSTWGSIAAGIAVAGPSYRGGQSFGRLPAVRNAVFSATLYASSFINEAAGFPRLPLPHRINSGYPGPTLLNAPNKGPYRGGSHAEMSGPRTRGDGLDSHHMPDRHANPTVHPDDGPAIQMDPLDHHATSSNGRHGAEAARYRAETAQMIREGRYRDAMAREIRDVRSAANEVSNDPRKYNEAIQEMLEYAKRTGQLPARN